MIRNTKIKRLVLKKKFYISLLAIFAITFLVYGIKVTYAYYTDSSSRTIFASVVGDFAIGSNLKDINLIVYKQYGNTSNYVIADEVPKVGYTFDSTDETKIETILECSSSNANCACDTDFSSSKYCHYSYDIATGLFTVKSSVKATLKVKFDRIAVSDVNLLIMQRDAAGTHSYNANNYKEVDLVPDGYTYSGYVCKSINSSGDETGTISTITITYTDGAFSITGVGQKANCYAYFN